MHELPITQSILEIVLKHAENAEAKRITDIHIIMGEFSKVVDESVQFYWDLIANDTIAEGATLHWRIIPAEFQCMACFEKFHPSDSEEFQCPNCGAFGVKIVAGEEFSLEAIDVE